MEILIRSALYFLALINPASKIFVLSTYQPAFSNRELRSVAIRSTLVAFLILAVLAWAGQYLLVQVFQV
jgi:small neutral amino acid transporter SnatA (MarC family)